MSSPGHLTLHPGCLGKHHALCAGVPRVSTGTQLPGEAESPSREKCYPWWLSLTFKKRQRPAAVTA